VLVLKLEVKRFQIVTPCLEIKLSASLVLVLVIMERFVILKKIVEGGW
jgi:hypothetical protein